MEYTIKQIAQLSGISSRTLRFYNERGLLSPIYLTEEGYWVYGEEEVDRLQQILLYRSVGVPLRTIKKLVDRSTKKIRETLLEQRALVVKKQVELDRLLKIFDNTLCYYKGEVKMTNKEKFESFKQASLLENNEKYGEALHENKDEEAVESTEQKWLEMSELDYRKMEEIENLLFDKLAHFIHVGDVPSSLAEEIFSLHRLWLQYSLKKYTKKVHRGLSEEYLSDERFTHYYNESCGLGATEALCEIIQYYTQ